jgi:hypothetical protein
MWWRCEVDGNHKIRWREKTEIREKIKGRKGKKEIKKEKGIMDFSPSPTTRRNCFTMFF